MTGLRKDLTDRWPEHRERIEALRKLAELELPLSSDDQPATPRPRVPTLLSCLGSSSPQRVRDEEGF